MNKTITKRLLSLVLLVVMLVGCALPAYAVDTGASGDLTAAYALRGTAYKDGVYEGTGKGFKDGEIKVKVTITDGKIAKVELVSQEKQSYWDSKNVSSLFDEIVKANSTEIDGVSGATMSSNGVKAAVNDALSKALVTARAAGRQHLCRRHRREVRPVSDPYGRSAQGVRGLGQRR